MTDLALGPGDDEEGPQPPAVPPSRTRYKLPTEEQATGPGAPAVRPYAERRRAELADRPLKGSTALRAVWEACMFDAVQGKLAQSTVPAQVFNANVARLRESQKLTDAQLVALFEKFAVEVRARRIDVNGKQPWFVFVRSLHRLGIAGVGLQQDQKRTREDWLT